MLWMNFNVSITNVQIKCWLWPLSLLSGTYASFFQNCTCAVGVWSTKYGTCSNVETSTEVWIHKNSRCTFKWKFQPSVMIKVYFNFSTMQYSMLPGADESVCSITIYIHWKCYLSWAWVWVYASRLKDAWRSRAVSWLTGPKWELVDSGFKLVADVAW